MTPDPSLPDKLHHLSFPRSSTYDARWVLVNSMGPNPLWLMEWLCGKLDLHPGMRVLDMGCGRAITSIFLAQQFGVQVWANDLWIQPADNWERVKEAGVSDRVFPIHAEAHALPYADEFFHAAVSVDAYHYFGTDGGYLGYYRKFIEPGGQVGIVAPGLTREFGDDVPEHLQSWVGDGIGTFCSAAWWERHWTKTGLVDVACADTLPQGAELWIEFNQHITKVTDFFDRDTEAVKADLASGRYVAFPRIVARKR